MFSKNEEVLESLAYEYRKSNGDSIDFRIHQNDFCILEDMLANLMEIKIEQLHDLIVQLIEEEKIFINRHIIYHAWYGSSAGRLYKMKDKNICGYKENLQKPCMEDDQLMMVISSEAIKAIFKKNEFNGAESFLDVASEVLEDSYKFSSFVQGIICGVDDSISKINFGTEFQIVPMLMPDNNDFLREYWYILDVFSFDNRFCNARIKGKVGVNTLITKEESRYLTEFLDEQGNFNITDTNIYMISSKVHKIITIFRIIRLVTKKTIWCSELIRCIKTRATRHSNPLLLESPYDYSHEDIYTISREEIDVINETIDLFSVDINDKIVELALKNYDYSFFVPEDVAIVLLVTCLEILFHPGDKDELKNRVARNAAVFLGSNFISSRTIFDDVKNFYDIRSSLVHSGVCNMKKIKKTEKDIIADLRTVVGRAIINYRIAVSGKGIKRDEFFDRLTSSGFDSNPFNIKQYRC